MKFGCKDKLGAKSPPEGDGVCELVQLLLCNFCFLGCPEVSSYHLQRGQGKVQGQQTLQFLFHPLPLQGFPGDGGEETLLRGVFLSASISDRGMYRTKGSLSHPSGGFAFCLHVWDVLHPPCLKEKIFLGNAFFSGMGQILETHFIYVKQMLRSFTQRDFDALRPFTLRGQSLWIPWSEALAQIVPSSF